MEKCHKPDVCLGSAQGVQLMDHEVTACHALEQAEPGVGRQQNMKMAPEK